MARDVNPGGEPVLTDRLREGAERLARSKLKRLLDILGSALGIIALSPLFAIAALAIMIESPGSPIFRQRRTGYRGVQFVIYKFRSMTVREDGAKVVQAQRGDQRVTRVGAFLRRTSIDELPQLFNVLKGEMSLVGPRPHALAHDTYYGESIAGYDLRFFTKPGLTGRAQVCGLRGPTPEISDMAARVEKDLEYICDWTITGDVMILLRTALIFAFQPTAI